MNTSDVKFQELVKLIRGIRSDALPARSISDISKTVCAVADSLLEFARELEARYPDE